MNRIIPRIGAGIVTAAVFLFAVCLLIDFSFGSYLVCTFLPIGYIMMAAGFYCESDEDRRVAANVGIVFSAVYAVLVLLVYFAQVTNVRLDDMTEQAVMLLDFKRGGLMFSYDLLGYGMLALSTFFIGLSIRAQSKPDRWLKGLLMIHGVFFFGCFIGRRFGSVCLLQPTSPLRSLADIVNSYRLLEEKQGDSVTSVCAMEHSPHWSTMLDEAFH